MTIEKIASVVDLTRSRIPAATGNLGIHANILEILSDAIVVYRDWEIIFANPAAADLFGAQDGGQLIGKNGLDFVHPDDRALILSIRTKTIEGKNVGPIRRRGLRLDGSVFQCESNASACTWEGAPAIIATIQDITESEKNAQALRESEERYRMLAEASPDGIMVHTDDVINFANSSFARIMGARSPNELIGRRALDLVSPQQKAEVLLRRKQVSAGEPVGLAEATFVRLDGSETRVERVVSPITWNGNLSFQVIVRDINERKRVENALRESEARFRAVVNYSPTKMHIKDADGRYILVNPVAEKLFGVTEEEAKGKTTHEIFPDTVAKDFVQHDRAVLQSGEVVEEEEQWNCDGGIRTYLTVKFPIIDDTGKITAIGAIGTDITERKQAAEALNVSKEQAELANRTKSEFLANMSHELRTPLNAIIGFSDMIRNQSFGPMNIPKYSEYADDINQSGTHLLKLINDILDLSKIEAGAIDLLEDTVDVSRAIDSCLHLIKARADAGGLAVTLDLDAPLPPLRADERKFKQILINLLSNAIKFTPAGGDVKVSVWASADDGYVFRIADTGIGIASNDIALALTPFKQVDGDLNRKFDGTGLGLPLAKSLAEMHGGSLELESEVGVGTTVTLRFPAERVSG